MDKEIRHGLRVYYTAVLNPKNCSYPDIELSNEGYGDIEFHYQPIVSKKSLRLKHGIIHKDNDPLSSWVCRHHKYAEYEAKMSYSRDRKTEYVHHKTIRGRLFHLIPFKATTRFFFSYFIFFGFLDGVRGFRYQFLLAIHYYLSKIFLDEMKNTLQLLK
jgi:hypothetical protein